MDDRQGTFVTEDAARLASRNITVQDVRVCAADCCVHHCDNEKGVSSGPSSESMLVTTGLTFHDGIGRVLYLRNRAVFQAAFAVSSVDESFHADD